MLLCHPQPALFLQAQSGIYIFCHGDMQEHISTQNMVTGGEREGGKGAGEGEGVGKERGGMSYSVSEGIGRRGYRKRTQRGKAESKGIKGKGSEKEGGRKEKADEQKRSKRPDQSPGVVLNSVRGVRTEYLVVQGGDFVGGGILDGFEGIGGDGRKRGHCLEETTG